MTTLIERYSTRDFYNRRADGGIILMFKQLIGEISLSRNTQY